MRSPRNELSDNEKSWMLIRAANLSIRFDHEPIGPPDDLLYNERYMHEAWRVLNWATEHEQNLRVIENGKSKPLAWVIYMTEFMLLPPADAQRLWLDTVLEMAIEAGLVEVDDE